MRIANGESARWRAVALQVEAWRRGTTALWIASVLLLLLTLLLAAWLSGEIPSPEWFRPINTFWWRLWP